MVPPRPDTSVPRSPPSDEAQRRERLRPQDGKPMLAPPGLEGLIVGSDVPPHKLQEARMIFAATCQHLATQPADIAAAERLVWLVAVLANTLLETGDTAGIRAITEAAMEVLMLPRHRQQMRARLAILAARANDLDSAEAWLAGCDPGSEDLQTDSAYRVARAMADTAARRPERVLEVLGASEQEVPIEDARDPSATVLRAHAFEQRGELDKARALLARFMTEGSGRSMVIDAILKSMPPDWHTCAQSIGTARQEVRQAVGQRAASGAQLMGYIFVLSGCVPLVIFVALAAGGRFEAPLVTMLLFPIIFGGIGLRMLSGARRSRRIATEGIHARGRITEITRTGTRINNVPVMQLHVELVVEGHGARKASAKRLIHEGQAALLVGREVGVIWHPAYPDAAVIDL